jgi:hypothetical protein
MNIILIVSFFAIILLFLYSVYRIFFVIDTPDMIAKWKIALMLIIVSSLFYFIYITTAISDLGLQSTISAGEEVFITTSNSYMLFFNLMPLITAVYLIQWLFFVVNILQGFGFFGRSRMKLHN